MSVKCITRKCVLLNCAYNLAINNFISGLITFYRASFHDMLGGFISIGLGVLLILGVRKRDVSILFSFLIIEAILLGFGTIEVVIGVTETLKETHPEFNVFGVLVIVGVFVSWVFMGTLCMLYRDFRGETVRDANECNENNDNELSKSVAV